jgi:hypothetical protein
MARTGRGAGRGAKGRGCRGQSSKSAKALAVQRDLEATTLADADAAKEPVALQPLRVAREDAIRAKATKAINDNFKGLAWSSFVKWEKQVENKFLIDYIMDRIKEDVGRGPAFYKELKEKIAERTRRLNICLSTLRMAALSRTSGQHALSRSRCSRSSLSPHLATRSFGWRS